MIRVQNAIKHNRCVLAVNPNLLKRDDIQKELKKRSVPVVSLDTETYAQAKPLLQENLTNAFDANGVIVMVEPDFRSQHLQDLATIVKGANPKPQLCVVAKSFNRFSLPSAIRLMNVRHIKMRGDLFLASLPEEEAAAPVESSKGKKSKKDTSQAPSSAFIGRVEEQKQLAEMLSGDGRPIVITGPTGIGKRWLTEQVLAATELKRIPDLHLTQHFGLDAFLGRLALVAKNLKDDRLQKAITNKAKRPTPSEMVNLIVEILQNDVFSNHFWVVSGIERLLDHRDKSFYKESTLEMILGRLFHSEIKLRLLFLSESPITIYNPELEPRQLALEGLKPDDCKAFFEAWRVPEEVREPAQALFERTLGHPIALRHIAIALRQGQTVENIEETIRGKLSDIHDNHKTRKFLLRQLDKLDSEQKKQLQEAALFTSPVPVNLLQLIGIPRAVRLHLLASGLLEQTPQQSSKRYYVHSATQRILKTAIRRGVDFEVMQKLGYDLLDSARKARKDGDLLSELLNIQHANVLLIQSRKRRDCWKPSVPFNDPYVQLVRELLFHAKKPDLAKNILQYILPHTPNHPDLLLIEQVSLKKDSKKSEIEEKFAHLHKVAGTPETYHQEASYHLERNAINKASKILKKGIEVFPKNGRLRRRVSSLLIRQNHLNDAIAILLNATELQPQMPDNFSMLGDIFTRLGNDHWEKAETSFAKAKELGKVGVPHLVRESTLLRARALDDLSKKTDYLTQAEDLLRKALELEKDNINAQVALATVLLDKEEDIEAAEIEKLLKPSIKRRDRAEAYIQKARLLIRNREFKEVETNLDRAYKLSNNNHFAFAVRGEYYFATGDIFRALQAFTTAIDRAPPSAPEISLYQNHIDKMKAIIESGRIAEVLADEQTETELMQQGDGYRREPGTVIRRKKTGEEEEEPSEESEESNEDEKLEESNEDEKLEESKEDEKSEESKEDEPDKSEG